MELELLDRQYSFYCDKRLADRFDEYCAGLGINKSAFFRNAMKRVLVDEPQTC